METLFYTALSLTAVIGALVLIAHMRLWLVRRSTRRGQGGKSTMFVSLGARTFYVEDEADCLIFVTLLDAIQSGVFADERLLDTWRVR